MQAAAKKGIVQFDQFAADYKQLLDRNVAISGEHSEYFAEYKACYLARRFTRSFSGKVLDFGCGVGLLSGFLKQHLPAAQLDGFDISSDSLHKIEPELTAQGIFTSDPNQLARNYDLIVVANVMHHIPRAQRQATISELTRRLNSKGKLAIFEHNPANPITRLVVERCPFDEDVILLPRREAVSYLAGAKLQPVWQNYIVFMPRLLAWFRPLEPALAWLPLGAQYVVVGQKHA